MHLIIIPGSTELSGRPLQEGYLNDRNSRYYWARFFCLFSAREHARAELRSAELSISLQISFFLFLCELSSP